MGLLDRASSLRRSKEDGPSRREMAEEERRRKKEERDIARQSRHFDGSSQRSLRRSTRSSPNTSMSIDGTAAYQQHQEQMQQQQHGYQPHSYYNQQQQPELQFPKPKEKSFFKKLFSFTPGKKDKSQRESQRPSEGGSMPPASETSGTQLSMPHASNMASRDLSPASTSGPQYQQGAMQQQQQYMQRSSSGAAHAGGGYGAHAGGGYGPGPGPGNDTAQVRDLQHRVSVLQAELQQVEELKRQLAAEQRTGNDWREKWNFQNFKLNLMVDMLVLRALELDGPRGNAPGGPGPGQRQQQQSGTAASSSPGMGRRATDDLDEAGMGAGGAIKRVPQIQATEFIEDSMDDFC